MRRRPRRCAYLQAILMPRAVTALSTRKRDMLIGTMNDGSPCRQLRFPVTAANGIGLQGVLRGNPKNAITKRNSGFNRGVEAGYRERANKGDPQPKMGGIPSQECTVERAPTGSAWAGRRQAAPTTSQSHVTLPLQQKRIMTVRNWRVGKPPD